MDLFQTPQLIPVNVQRVLNTFDDNADGYKELQRLEDSLKPLGYTFSWYLDAEPYNLRPIPTKPLYKVGQTIKLKKEHITILAVYKPGHKYAPSCGTDYGYDYYSTDRGCDNTGEQTILSWIEDEKFY